MEKQAHRLVYTGTHTCLEINKSWWKDFFIGRRRSHLHSRELCSSRERRWCD